MQTMANPRCVKILVKTIWQECLQEDEVLNVSKVQQASTTAIKIRFYIGRHRLFPSRK